MSNAIFQFSMRRSGTHAIAHWIAINGKPCLFFRDCHFYVEGGQLSAEGPIVYLDDPELEPFNLEPDEPMPVFSDQNFILHNFEDLDPHFCIKRMNAIFSNDLWPIVLPIVILRDPYNWIASRLKGGFPDQLGIEKAIELYKVHMKYKDEEGVAYINYNKWHTDKEYRLEVANKLNLSTDDVDHDKFHSRAKSKFDNENVLERYKEVDVSAYIDDELKEFAKAEFGIEVD